MRPVPEMVFEHPDRPTMASLAALGRSVRIWHPAVAADELSIEAIVTPVKVSANAAPAANTDLTDNLSSVLLIRDSFSKFAPPFCGLGPILHTTENKNSFF